jgi:glycosyltransferase involved in cell wall biosynthesis
MGVNLGKLVFYSFIFFLFGLFLFSITFFIWFLKILNFPINDMMKYMMNVSFNFANLIFLFFGLSVFLELGLIPKIKKEQRKIKFDPIIKPKISVVMTAYNDELSVGTAVDDFKSIKPMEIVVVDNNCTDNTAKIAMEHGAIVVKEKKQGYGYACIRALKSARGNLIILTESDQTFSSSDAKKFISYIENADMVVGTRTTQELLAQNSQLDWFLNWGNQFLAKFIQLKFWNKIRLTDVGCTYRIIRRKALDKIINKLYISGSDFSPHMIMVALENNLKVIEIPITFRERVGISKAIGRNKWKGIKLGLKMMWLILTS